MRVSQYDPRRDQASRAASVTGRRTADTTVRPYHEDPAGSFRSFVMSAGRENVPVSVMTRMGDPASGVELGGFNPEFNPYKYLADTREQHELDRLLPFIGDGTLEEAADEEQADALFDAMSAEATRMEQAMENPVAAFFGAFVGAALDPVSYALPFGLGRATTAAGTIGRMSAYGAASAGMSETALQQTQRIRSPEESLMNIGASAVLGGGLGAFAAANRPSHPLHPHNELNPFRRENLNRDEMIVSDAAGGRDVISPQMRDQMEDEIAAMGGVRGETDSMSVGAAAREDIRPSDTLIAGEAAQTRIGQGLEWVGRKMAQTTIAGRIPRFSSPLMRRVGIGMVDPGGVMLRGHTKGKTMGVPAESLRKQIMNERVDMLFNRMNEREARELYSKGIKPSKDELVDLTDRVLLNIDSDELFARMVKKFGNEEAHQIRRVAEENAEDIHATNAAFEKDLIRHGILRDDERLAQLQSSRDAARDRVKALREDVDESGRPKDPEGLQAARRERDMMQREYRNELGKPEPMGRDYGRAQTWNNDNIIRKPAEFRAFLRDVLARDPDQEWLQDNFAADGRPLSEAGDDAVPMTREDLEELRTTDRETYDRILEDWSGDAYYFRLRQAEERHTAAKQAEKEAKMDAMDVFRRHNELRREETSLDLQTARKRRDKIQKQLQERRQLKDVFRSESRVERVEGGADPQLELPAYRDFVRSHDEWMELQRKAQDLDKAVRELETRQADTRSRRQAVKDMLSEARRERGIRAKDARSARRELMKARKAPGLDKLVDDVYESLATTGQLPSGTLQHIRGMSDAETGRIKARQLHLNPEQRTLAYNEGWLDTDMIRGIENSSRKLAGELAMRDALDIGPGRRFESKSQVRSEVRDEYDSMISEAPDEATRTRLAQEKKVALADLDELTDRLLARSFPDDRTVDGTLMWLGQKVREATFARFIGGMLSSSLPDTGSMVQRHGNYAKLIAKHGKIAASQVVRSHRGDWSESEFNTFAASLELGSNAASYQARLGAQDVVTNNYMSRGIGTGMKRQITGAVDRTMGRLSYAAGLVSGMPTWTRFNKIVASHAMAGKIRDVAARSYDDLDPRTKGDLATVGLGRSELRAINDQINRYGRTDSEGHFDPGLENWTNDEAMRAFKVALIRDMDRAVITPGIGDTPRLMSNQFAQLLLQFMTFSFAWVNRMGQPMVQGMRAGERQSMAAGAWLLGATLFGTIPMKDLQAGRDPRERFELQRLPDTLREAVDRSGLTGPFAPYIDATLTVAGFGSTTRFQQNTAFENIMGVNYGFPGELSRTVASVAEAEPEAINQLISLAPFGSTVRILSQPFTD